MDLNNKLWIVTGANSGIDKETVRIFARQGVFVVIICRNELRTPRAQQEFFNNTIYMDIKAMLADLDIQHHVREVARQILQKQTNKKSGTYCL